MTNASKNKTQRNGQSEKSVPWRTPTRTQKETGKAGVEAKCKRWLRDRKYLVRKVKSPQNRGMPDDLVARLDVSPFFVEFKAPGKKHTVTDGQSEEHAALRAAGLEVVVFDDVELFKTFVIEREKKAEWL